MAGCPIIAVSRGTPVAESDVVVRRGASRPVSGSNCALDRPIVARRSCRRIHPSVAYYRHHGYPERGEAVVGGRPGERDESSAVQTAVRKCEKELGQSELLRQLSGSHRSWRMPRRSLPG